MPIVVGMPAVRFQRLYKKRWTVLEGSELSCLLEHFFKHIKRCMKKGDDSEIAVIHSISHAFHTLYPHFSITEDELKHLSSPDARKMDLFFRGMMEIFSKNGTPPAMSTPQKKTPPATQTPSNVIRLAPKKAK